ncbi:putative remorin [Medicago truncatula]|uniref:Carboxy-terminal region remorin n=1 Tax=Medicago truncatula TaxID=3880 RepID=G7K6N7_MEDTR|nr:uncharacterized protein LOC11407347 [Medicago truncatula]AES94694.1 carboxy-terminal region remorin [Medicago truncatula]RHN54025.1 putative remorin [Medicago truncatula]
MKKNSGPSQKLGSFLSPKEPNYREKNIENQKGWNSERVLLHPTTSSNIRRQAYVAGVSPFNSGRTIPSKWDDAERWICSPVSSSGYVQHQRNPKSKSGPIVPQGTTYYSNFSPTIPLRNGLVVKNLMMSSPFTTGVLAPDIVSLQHYYPHDNLYGARYDIDDDSSVVNENGVAHTSASNAPSWSELLSDPSSPNSHDEKFDGTKNEDTVMSPMSKIDKGTQMSSPETENEDHSSPKSSSPILAMNPKSCHSEKLEIKDVQVDCQANVIKWSKSYASKLSSFNGKELKKSGTEASGLDIAETTSDTSSSKFERDDEAKIIAWESLQKAKAEAAIRKLEMKLEKKKSSSMDKILNKLRRAQMKAEKMRSLTPVQQEQHVSKTWKVFSFTKYGKIWSPSSCFASHAP